MLTHFGLDVKSVAARVLQPVCCNLPCGNGCFATCCVKKGSFVKETYDFKVTVATCRRQGKGMFVKATQKVT